MNPKNLCIRIPCYRWPAIQFENIGLYIILLCTVLFNVKYKLNPLNGFSLKTENPQIYSYHHWMLFGSVLFWLRENSCRRGVGIILGLIGTVPLSTSWVFLLHDFDWNERYLRFTSWAIGSTARGKWEFLHFLPSGSHVIKFVVFAEQYFSIDPPLT